MTWYDTPRDILNTYDVVNPITYRDEFFEQSDYQTSWLDIYGMNHSQHKQGSLCVFVLSDEDTSV